MRRLCSARPRSGIPERVVRHSLAARLFHWVMAAAMFALLATSFLPIVGVQFAWVAIHWQAGLVLTLAVVYHIVHASVWLDFWSIWPTPAEMSEEVSRVRLSLGQLVPAPRKAAKYPFENKLYHLAILASGLSVIGTGVFMLFRVRTGILPRNPYLLADLTWGVMYVVHGLAGIGLVALVIVHVYFAVRPEKLPITLSMTRGWMSREFYLSHHDPRRWVVTPSSAVESRPTDGSSAG